MSRISMWDSEQCLRGRYVSSVHKYAPSLSWINRCVAEGSPADCLHIVGLSKGYCTDGQLNSSVLLTKLCGPFGKFRYTRVAG